MPVIRVETEIAASVERCFDLARDVRIHELTTSGTREKVVEVLRDGKPLDLSRRNPILLELDDVVTFEATHLGVRQQLASRIVTFERPHEFTDEMQRGAFRKLRHVHRFVANHGGTVMEDILEFVSPAWILGRFANYLFLTRYMTRFLKLRGNELRRIAEAEPR